MIFTIQFVCDYNVDIVEIKNIYVYYAMLVEIKTIKEHTFLFCFNPGWCIDSDKIKTLWFNFVYCYPAPTPTS